MMPYKMMYKLTGLAVLTVLAVTQGPAVMGVIQQAYPSDPIRAHELALCGERDRYFNRLAETARLACYEQFAVPAQALAKQQQEQQRIYQEYMEQQSARAAAPNAVDQRVDAANGRFKANDVRNYEQTSRYLTSRTGVPERQ